MDHTNNTVTIKYYSTKFVFKKTNRETSETFYAVGIDCPESENGFCEICLPESNVRFSYDEKHCDLVLGDPEKSRRVSIKLNGRYVNRYYPNKKIEDMHKEYLKARRAASKAKRMEAFSIEEYPYGPM